MPRKIFADCYIARSLAFCKSVYWLHVAVSTQPSSILHMYPWPRNWVLRLSQHHTRRKFSPRDKKRTWLIQQDHGHCAERCCSFSLASTCQRIWPSATLPSMHSHRFRLGAWMWICKHLWPATCCQVLQWIHASSFHTWCCYRH